MVRRVVTGYSGGKSKVVCDGGTRRAREFTKNIPGQSAALMWSTPAVRPCRSTAPSGHREEHLRGTTGRDAVDVVVTCILIQSLMTIDPSSAVQEFIEHIPGPGATMETDRSRHAHDADGRLRDCSRGRGAAGGRRRQAGSPQASRHCGAERDAARMAEQGRQAGQDSVRSDRSEKELRIWRNCR